MAAAASIWGDQIRIQVAFNRRLRAVGAPPGYIPAGNLLAQLDRGVVLARRIQNAFANALIGALSESPAYLDFTLKLNRQVRLRLPCLRPLDRDSPPRPLSSPPNAYDRFMGRYSVLLAPQLADYVKSPPGSGRRRLRARRAQRPATQLVGAARG